jgi:hypothetical protein
VQLSKGWAKACKLAGIDLLPFHAAGRHGFGQEKTSDRVSTAVRRWRREGRDGRARARPEMRRLFPLISALKIFTGKFVSIKSP